MHSRANPLSSRHQIPSKGVWNVGKNGTKYSVISDTLGLMNPLSNSSCNCFFNSTSSTGASR
ncbi:hypothetical protein LINGRAHAP2_LOCUS24120 [Linum grandiflorum]